MSFSAVVSLGMGAMIGAGIFALLGEAGGMAVLMYLAGLLSLALVAKTFGNYGAALVPGSPGWLAPLLAVGVMVLFVAVNLRGSVSVGRVELWIVLFKFAVLLTLAIGGLTVLKPSLLAPSTYPGASSIAAKDHALAEAARPVFGSVGVAAVAVTALVTTASAINASLFSVTNVAYKMAKNGELPGLFRRHVRNGREGLLVSGFVVAIAAVAFDLSQIAVLGAISILLVHTAVHVGHLRLLGDTGANKWVVALAAAAAITIVVVTLVDAARYRLSHCEPNQAQIRYRLSHFRAAARRSVRPRACRRRKLRSRRRRRQALPSRRRQAARRRPSDAPRCARCR
jgi:amino acid transporter